jgi:SPP1 family predicted phage head-tail adaptor
MRDYRHKITFLRLVKGYDDFGSPVNTWETYKDVWASKDPLLGNEYLVAQTTDSKVEVKFNMRYVDGVTNDMRIRHGDELYEILSAINVKSLNRETLCYCKLVK